MTDRTGLTPARVVQIVKDATSSGALPVCCTPFLSPDAKRDSGPGAVIVPSYGQFVFADGTTLASISFEAWNIDPGATFTSVLGLAVIVPPVVVTQNALPAADTIDIDLDLTTLPDGDSDFITITNPCGCSAGIQITKEEGV